MNIEYRKADIEDAELLINIYNEAFYSDYKKYGECPAYGKTKESMESSIQKIPKFIIIYDNEPVGVISCKELEPKSYEVGCLCVLPKYQGKGLGSRAFQYALSYYKDWQKFTLITPADKDENVRFYTEKCGFEIDSIEMDGSVKVFRFIKKR